MSGTCIQKLSKTMRHSKTMMRSKTMIHPKTIMHSKAIVHSKCLVNPRGSIYDTYKYTNYDAFKITNPGAFKIKAVMHSKTVMHSRSMCIRKENSGAFKTKTLRYWKKNCMMLHARKRSIKGSTFDAFTHTRLTYLTLANTVCVCVCVCVYRWKAKTWTIR